MSIDIHTGGLQLMAREGFNHSGDLATHKLTHTGENPNFQCAVCKTIFTEEQSLQLHKESHFKNGELVLCSICGREMIQST
jgi:hypothetical protein